MKTLALLPSYGLRDEDHRTDSAVDTTGAIAFDRIRAISAACSAAHPADSLAPSRRRAPCRVLPWAVAANATGSTGICGRACRPRTSGIPGPGRAPSNRL
ncbi:hypothetical protein G6F63_016570 [Rhizopus arrhizus]|nr:hypothetical protein G6F63_016570 [Rhizopus arrhizus]